MNNAEESTQITITNVFEAREIVKQHPHRYRVVSISSPRSKLEIEGAAELLQLKFDDITEKSKRRFMPNNFRLATIEDCRRALEFLDQGGACLVHCSAGVSRSTAVALGYLLSKFSRYQDAVDRVFEIRPQAIPNEYIVDLMCRLLNREHELEAILQYIRSKD